MEIEKKYLVKYIPENLNEYESFNIVQAYIAKSPTIRIRKSNDNYYLTVKGKGHIVRQEFEMHIEKHEYESLLLKTDGEPIQKVRYNIPICNDLVAELDIFNGRLDGLVTVEVEFISEDQAQAFEPPDWFGDDVSMDKAYKNSYLV